MDKRRIGVNLIMPRKYSDLEMMDSDIYLREPTNDAHAVNKAYVDKAIENANKGTSSIRKIVLNRDIIYINTYKDDEIIYQTITTEISKTDSETISSIILHLNGLSYFEDSFLIDIVEKNDIYYLHLIWQITNHTFEIDDTFNIVISYNADKA